MPDRSDHMASEADKWIPKDDAVKAVTEAMPPDFERSNLDRAMDRALGRGGDRAVTALEGDDMLAALALCDAEGVGKVLGKLLKWDNYDIPPLFENARETLVAMRVMKELEKLPSYAARRAAIKALWRENRTARRNEAAKRNELRENLRKVDEKLDGLSAEELRLQSWDDLADWLEGDLPLGRCDGSMLRKLLDAVTSGESVGARYLGLSQATLSATATASFGSIDFQDFLVQHDWAKALTRAPEFSDGEFRLPYPDCAFEFHIGGRRVIALFLGDDHEGVDMDGYPIYCALSTKCSTGWITFAGWYINEGRWISDLDADQQNGDYNKLVEPLRKIVADQVMAISVALEAEVAETEIVRASYKMNRIRERDGKLPLFDHHVVKLARRSRAPALPAEYHGTEDQEKRRSPRFHFRRGHWRHFSNHKAWIKWMLVGDPDLGWIEKEYAL
jgi:hypothetical protein